MGFFRCVMVLRAYRNEREFGLLLAAIAAAAAVWPLLAGGALKWLWLLAALLPLLLAWRAPQWLTPLARGWLWLGHLLGHVNSRVILALIFFLLITPLALLFRMVGRDELRLRQGRRASYWIARERRWPPESFRDQF